jgi:hypothetical protein
MSVSSFHFSAKKATGFGLGSMQCPGAPVVSNKRSVAGRKKEKRKS